MRTNFVTAVVIAFVIAFAIAVVLAIAVVIVIVIFNDIIDWNKKSSGFVRKKLTIPLSNSSLTVEKRLPTFAVLW